MPIGGAIGGVLGWLLFGVAIYAWLSYRDPSVTQPKTDPMSDPGLGGGPWQHPTNSQTPVPLVFGKVQTPLPMVHYRLEGDQYRDMWLIYAVCEQWSTLAEGYTTQLGKITVNDIALSDFPRYTSDPNVYDRKHDWARFYENGRNINIYWSSSGKHTFVRSVEAGSSIETYSLQCTRDNVGGNGVQLKVRCIHQFDDKGTTQYWRVKVFYVSTVSGSPEILVYQGSQHFILYQHVEAGKDSQDVPVGGTLATVHTVTLPYKGTFKVILELVSSTNEGRLYLDSVELVDDQLQSETVSSYGTSMVLLRIQDGDGTMVRPQVIGEVTGGPSNPAEALLWALTNTEVSLGIESLYLDDISFTEAAAKCDEYGYRFNRAYCATNTFETVIKDMLSAGRLLLGEYGGKISCIFDEEVPVAKTRVVDIDTMTDNVNYGDTTLQNIPNRFSIKYVEGGVQDTVQDLLLEDIDLQSKAGVINERTIELYGVTNQAKAWELGWYHAIWSQASKWLEFDMKPLLWDLSPGSVIKTVSEDDPYLDSKEWMMVGFDETEPGRYRAKAIQYMREAYTAPTYVEEYPDVYIETPTFTSDTGQSPKIPGGAVQIAVASIVPLATAPASRVTISLSEIPSEATQCKIYKSLDGVSYTLLSSIAPSGSSYSMVYTESDIWTYTWYKVTVMRTGMETPLEGAPTKQVYIVGHIDFLPGYGQGAYGWQPYGG